MKDHALRRFLQKELLPKLGWRLEEDHEGEIHLRSGPIQDRTVSRKEYYTELDRLKQKIEPKKDETLPWTTLTTLGQCLIHQPAQLV